MIRGLMFMEKALTNELFNPQFKEERKENIFKILFSDIPNEEYKQEFLLLLQDMFNLYHIKVAQMIIKLIEQEFNEKKHIGRVSLWDYQTKEDLKNKVNNPNKPTHLISYQTSSVNTYFLPSMKGIYPISIEDFWKEPNNIERKQKLVQIAESTTNSSKKSFKLKKQALERGWSYTDIGEKTQMLLHGVGNFQVFCFGYASGHVLSLVDYKTRSKNKNNFDSDSEEDVYEENQLPLSELNESD